MYRQVLTRTMAVITALLYLAVLAVLVPDWVRSNAVTQASSAVIPPSDAVSFLPALSSTLPAGWPTTLELGMADKPGGAQTLQATADFGFRYQYLAGGVNTGGGWATWGADGAFVPQYIRESIESKIIPVFSYYMIVQSAPGSAQPEKQGVHTNLQNTATMTAYYNDLKLFFQRAGAFPDTMVLLQVEPDLWGYIQQISRQDDAATVPTKVSASGLTELADLPDNATGLAHAIIRLRDRYAPNVVIGYHLSIWGTGVDVLNRGSLDPDLDVLATRAANFYRSLQTDFDIVFAEYSDRDAGFNQYVRGMGDRAWWHPGDFDRNVRFLERFASAVQKRFVMWQIPYGNTKMRAVNNTWYHYQDNKVEWLLDDPSRAHLNEYMQAGVAAFLFGGGADGTTDASDVARDGVTDPEPINGNTGLSLSADDDGGFFRQKAREYYAAGPLLLPSGENLAATPREDLRRTPDLMSVRGASPSSGEGPAPMPVISRNVPAYSSATSSYEPRLANDDNYGTNWRSGTMPAWLAYDLSNVPATQRGKVVIVWYNNATGDYDHTVGGGVGYNIPGSYTIDANAAAGGTSAPTSGWVTLASVTGNTFHSRQHLLDLTGYNWLRINFTASDGSPLNDDVAVNFDVHDASRGVEDDWIFYGDSITAAAMAVAPNGALGTFAQLVNSRVPSHFPLQEAGGTGYLRSDAGARLLDAWLAVFPGRYVALSYGTNDSGAISPDGFYRNYVSMVEAVLRAGKVPVVPKIPWARNANIRAHGLALNDKIEALYAAYPQIVRGPDFWGYFQDNQGLISSDDLHPILEGYAAYRQQWVDRMVAAVYTAPADSAMR